MISIKEKWQCCGCGNCALSCPTDAIKMISDEVGFTFPSINNTLCTNCGLCETKCPVLNHKNDTNLNHEVYAAYAKDTSIRFNGSSGGMFGMIAKHILNSNGIVYGAAFDNKLKLKCTCAKTENELYDLYKSKYLQSDLGESFFHIKKALDSGISVLFVSTPCQVYALKLFLKKEYQKLTTIDFICHGVPSQDFFDKCKSFVEEKEKIQLLSYSFRAKKKNGATPHYYQRTYLKNGKKKTNISLYTNSPFYYGFQKYITLRDSCYNCQFSCSNRVSDITIGDFHEIDKYIKGINRFDGVSTVVINTEKGAEIWGEVCHNAVSHKLDFKTLLNNGDLMCGGTTKPKNRDLFINDLALLPFEIVVDKHLNGKNEYIKKFYYSMPSVLRKILKKVLIK